MRQEIRFEDWSNIRKKNKGKTNKNNFEELETKIKTKRTLENRYMRRN